MAHRKEDRIRVACHTCPICEATCGLEILVDGGAAEVSSRVGTVRAPVEVTDLVRPDVVSFFHGWGHDLEGVRMKVARAHGDVNSKVLSDDQVFDPVFNNAVLNGIPVKVRPVVGRAERG